MVLQLPVNLIRETLPTVCAEYAVELVLAQLMQFFTARQPLKILVQLSAGSLGLLGNNSDILYFRLRLGFVAYILNLIENIRLPQAIQPLRAASETACLHDGKLLRQDIILLLKLHHQGDDFLFLQTIQFFNRVLLHRLSTPLQVAPIIL